jgi:hypothetical protein
MTTLSLRVFAPDLEPSCNVCVTGDLEELGAWAFDKVVEMEKEDDQDMWTIDLPLCAKSVEMRILYRLVIKRGGWIHNWEPFSRSGEVRASVHCDIFLY